MSAFENEYIDRNVFFSLKKYSKTRGHEVTLVKDQYRLDIMKYSLSQRKINRTEQNVYLYVQYSSFFFTLF